MKTAATMTILLGALLAPQAEAQFTGTFQNAVLANFNSQDMTLMQAALDATLHDPKDGTAREWKNADTAASGAISALKSYSSGTTACRDLSVLNRYKMQQSKVVYKFCQDAKGAWKLVS